MRKEVFAMLNENIKNLRKQKGLSQEEFAIKLNVVRQTVSKWERGLSVPDSDMLLSISEVLQTPVSVLLGETVQEKEAEDLKAIAEKLEVINLQLARKNDTGRKRLRWFFILVCIFIVVGFIIAAAAGSPYQDWDYNDPELAAAGTILHGIEFVFVRVAPFVLIGSIVGIVLTCKRKR